MSNHNITGVATLGIGGVLLSPAGSGGQLVIGGTGGLSVSTGDFNVNGFSTFARSITVAGTVYASDSRLKKNVSGLSDIRSRLFRVTPREYNYITNASKAFRFDDKQHYGFIAQDVQKVFPELTAAIDEEGHLGVNYIEFIPMLLQVIREDAARIDSLESRLAGQEAQIARLSERLSLLEDGRHDAPDAAKPQAAVSAAPQLGQNIPNPFSGETAIPYAIPGAFSDAFIGIYDLNGKQMSRIRLERNEGRVTVLAAALTDGMYVYNLVVDGRLIDTKKMVISR